MDENGTRQCNPSLPVEMVEDAQKIKGDAIGNTLYSQCWVLKVLMKLAQLSKDNGLFVEELEKELCLLWDMTAEEDVVRFLVDNNVIDIVIITLQKEQEPRLMEILVGLLANLCVVADVCHRVMSSAAVCDLMLKLLYCVDSLTLVQLMRLYTTCLLRLQDSRENVKDGNGSVSNKLSSDKVSLSCENGNQTNESAASNNLNNMEKHSSDITFVNMLLDTDKWYKQIAFLLQSSTNRTLLSSMLEMLGDLYVSLTYCGPVLPSVCTAEMIAAVLEALKELKAGVSASLSTEVPRKALFDSVSLLSNYLDSEQGIAALCEMSDALSSYVCSNVDEEHLCSCLSLDSVQFLMHCFNILGCTFTSLVCKTDVSCWSVSLLGHLTERSAAKRKPLCGEDGFEAEDKEEEEKYFDSSELTSASENLCVFIAKCLSGGESSQVKWTEIEEALQGRCESKHLSVLKSVLQKHGLEEETVH